MAAYGRQPRLVEAAVEKRWLVHPVRLRCRSAGTGGGVEVGTCGVESLCAALLRDRPLALAGHFYFFFVAFRSTTS
jgi:hypothetical protein